MLAVFNAGGEIITLTPSQVNQGSNKANTIYIVMPLAPTNVLQARFRLPNGKFTTPVTVPVAPETGYLGLTDQDGNKLYMWSYSIPSALTAYAGNVLAQFTATNEELVTKNEQVTNEGRVLATFSFEFEVLEGVPPITVGNIDSYQSVIDALQSINIAITNNVNTLQGEINELENTKQNKTDSALQTESKQVVGAINELNTELEQLKELDAGTTVTVDGSFVSIFNADTKLDVTAFEEYEAKIDAILDRSEILTIEEITSQYNEQATGNSRNVLNGSEVNVLAVAGDSKQPENLMPLHYNIVSYYPGVSATASGRFVSVTTTAATAPRYIKLCEGEFEKGTYYLYGNLQKFSNAALYVEYDGGVPFRDYGEGVKVELDEDKTLKFYIAFDEGAVAGTYNFFPIFQKDTMGIVSATFAGIKSESKNLAYPFELAPVSSVRDYAEATVNNNIITVNVHTRLDLTSTTNIKYFAVKRGLNLTQGRYIITGSPQSSIDSVCLHIEYYEGGPYKTAEDVGNGVEFTIDRDSTATLYISLGNKTQIGEYVFTPALRKYAPDGTLEDVWNFPKTELPIGTTLNFLSKTKTKTYAEYTFTGDETWAEVKQSPSNANYYQGYFNNWQNLIHVDVSTLLQKGLVCDRYTLFEADSSTATLDEPFIRISSSGTFFVFIPTDLVDASNIGKSYRNLTKGMTIRYPTTSANTEWYRTEDFTPEQVSAGNSYEAYYEGTEAVLGNDSSAAGTKNTITAEYVVLNKVKQG